MHIYIYNIQNYKMSCACNNAHPNLMSHRKGNLPPKHHRVSLET